MDGLSPLLVVTPGEPAGIGPEITLKLARDHPELRLLAVADPDCLRRAAATMQIDVELAEWRPGPAPLPGTLGCLPVKLCCEERAGNPDPQNAAYVLQTLRRAVELVRHGHAGALVTGPVNKAVINQAGIAFSGHTEFLAELAGVEQVVMMLAAPGLRVALVTTHLPLRAVADAITPQKLEAVIRITINELHQRFGIVRPRLQVLGLNPHAGEQGHLGWEDDLIIRPAIELCRSESVSIDGPVPADTAFTPPRLAACDAVIAMYHDQGLPVLKHFGFGRAVNITLGLPFVRTSVDHGTALDIAGSGRAEASSLFQAAQMAAQLSMQRTREAANPLGPEN
jgi:4-hydroxythreonine-4-phosphate dehydrogenase